MQRYFVEPRQFTEQDVIITGDDVHHITNVMRGDIGDEILVSDGQGRVARARLTERTAKQVRAEIVEWLDERRELPVRVTIGQGLPKGDKLEWIIQKGTELGAHAFFPFQSERTIVKLDAKKEDRKRERWSRIAKEAAEQAHRSVLPEVLPVRRFDEAIAECKRYDACVIAYEQEDQTTLRDVLDRLRPGDSLLVLIGPEGGFSPQEVRSAAAAGAIPVSLGPRILRTETASQYVLAAVSYHFEMTGGKEGEQ